MLTGESRHVDFLIQADSEVTQKCRLNPKPYAVYVMSIVVAD